MRTLSLLAITGLLASTSWANNLNLSTAVGELSGEALKLEKLTEVVSSQLNSVPVNPELLEKRVEALYGHIQRIKAMVAEIEAAQPNLTASQRTNWELVKNKVQLLDTFAATKRDLLEKGDPNTNRAQLKSQADGIVKRAALLQQTARKI